jgi:hypothetical protein
VGAIGEDKDLLALGEVDVCCVLDCDGGRGGRSALGFFDQHGGRGLLVDCLRRWNDQARDSGLGAGGRCKERKGKHKPQALVDPATGC